MKIKKRSVDNLIARRNQKMLEVTALQCAGALFNPQMHLASNIGFNIIQFNAYWRARCHVEQFVRLETTMDKLRRKSPAMKARIEVMRALQAEVRAWRVTQGAAGHVLGLTQPRVSQLLRGNVEEFSLDALIELLSRAGLKASISVRRLSS